jgi:hypothetical protein
MEMVWFDTFPKVVPDNACTTEHLDDRLDPNRGILRGQPRRVAACKKCNEDRSNARVKLLPIEELRKRSRRGKRFIYSPIAEIAQIGTAIIGNTKDG